MLTWDEIMVKAPFMKDIVEKKVAEEVAKKDIEISQLKSEKNELGQKVFDLETTLIINGVI